ncbi:PA3496 family putative envelope integrity protein [Marinomonas ostreistagni]|uniref:PA3496 family putative envelope integrity protein n=1 Tax=Marinomonas ostreistagni TaxID=359209 RepID=UPI00194F2B6B|nr:hypothetical protein [Marinomonas ostreistagni]MBM6550625.1 hypothetical protein [Marinomonas ostreistagni]
MSTPVETIAEVKTDLLYASISLKKEETERNQKEGSERMRKARRAIEDYLEEKRLSQAISDGWDD